MQKLVSYTVNSSAHAVSRACLPALFQQQPRMRSASGEQSHMYGAGAAAVEVPSGPRARTAWK